MPLFRIFGIEVRLDLSVVIIFALIVYSLGSGIFKVWHPDWSSMLVWSTALTAGILFFVSLLAHELAHSVVAQHYGIPVPRITLFLFGGMAETSREPDSAKVEFLVALAGPMMSLVISIACSTLAVVNIEDGDLLARLGAGEAEALATLGPMATALVWLGSINMILAIFNLIPGFPMDGGRVFRAFIWAVTGDHLMATRWASNLGRLFGWSLMALGVLSLFGGHGFSGVWYILIGWFIANLAQLSYSQLVTERALAGFRVVDLMEDRFETVDAGMPLTRFVDDCLLRSIQPVWPVADAGQLVGFVSLPDVIDIPGENRERILVREAMKRVADVPMLDADTSAQVAIDLLAGASALPVPVMRAGQLVGFIQRGDIVRWLALHEFGRH